MKYTKSELTSKIPLCNILGVNIAAINMEWLIEFTNLHIESLKKNYMCVVNVYSTVKANEDKYFLDILNQSVLSIPDGKPLSIIGRKRGYTNIARIAGPSYMEEIFKISNKYNYKHFFYGSTDKTMTLMILKLKELYPSINIVGFHTPPFKDNVEKLDQSMVDIINRSGADFIWVGLGAPKQEEWMFLNKDSIDGFMVGVGAGFDYIAGNIQRAPTWMQEVSLEWFYRLLQEPRRLLLRYLTTNSKFIWLILTKKRSE